MNNSKQSFNLYREAKDHYEFLIPKRLEGLILLNLFEKFGKEEFNEERISDIIDKVHKDFGRQTQRNEYERNNAIILRFQEFFLWRDQAKKIYKFKSYGIEFCNKIKERLFNRYSPAEIKRLFDSLYHELVRHLETEDLNFNLWFREQFVRRNTEIASQVEILDQQVSESVREFRKRIKDDQDLFQLLEEIEMSLNEIKTHASLLKEAFKATYDIDNKLEDLLADPNAQELITDINEVMDFNSNIRAQLEQVSIRIDRIKPRIREFIYDFNQRNFDRKTGLFLNLLLSSSKQTKDDSGKKILVLPNEIPQLAIYNTPDLPKFIAIPERDITPKAPVEVVHREINIKRQAQLTLLSQQKFFERQRVEFWFKHVFSLLETHNKLNFTQIFFEILTQENANLSIAVRVTNKLISQLSKNKNYSLTIIQETEGNPLFKNINLWKMNIQKA